MYTEKRNEEYNYIECSVLEKTDDVTLCRWGASFGRMGSLDGLFFTTRADVDSIMSEDVYFGEVLGKHSDITYTVNRDDFEFIDLDKTSVETLLNVLADSAGTITGFNPIVTFLERKADNEEDE